MVGGGVRRHALIDREAFAANLTAVAPDFLDARADAFGHSIALLGPVARATRVTAIVVSDERDAATAREAGFTDVRIARLVDGGYPDAVYGVDGSARPVLTLVGEVIAVKHVSAGAGVSYGYTHRTPHATNLALVGLGYADGVPRLASNRASVRLGGASHPLVGRIAMDQLVVSCGDDTPQPGSEAILFGDPSRGEPSAAEWAQWTERPALALTAGLGDRIRRLARTETTR